MPQLYLTFAAVFFVAVVVTGILWTVVTVRPQSRLRARLRDIRAVHFGSLYFAGWFCGLGWALGKLEVPAEHQAAFPAGVVALAVFGALADWAGKPPNPGMAYYWGRGWRLAFSLLAIAGLSIGILWTAAVMAWFALRSEW